MTADIRKVVALAGGVGGAKLAYGLSRILPEDHLSIIVNTGDDFDHLGLHISPDLDTVMYSLAEEDSPETGWGKKGESWNCLNELKRLNSETWFGLGDKDLATHLERTRLLRQGLSLTQTTRQLCKALAIENSVLPMTDQRVETIIETVELGSIPFQEYFVKHRFSPTFKGYYLKGIEVASISDEVKRAVEQSDIVIFCPSNPWLSILPILSVNGLREAIKYKACVAVSPIVGSQAIKGPAAKIFAELGIKPCASAVADIYRGVIQGIVIDQQNHYENERITGWGIMALVTDTVMDDRKSKVRLAREVYQFASRLYEETK